MRRQSKSLALVALFSFVLFSGFLCTGSQIHKLTVAEHDFKIVVQNFQDAEIAEFSAGHVDPVEHQRLQTGILAVAQAGIQLTNLINQGQTAPVTQQLINVTNAISALNTNGVLQIKNQQSKAILQLALQAIQNAITNAQTILA